MAVLNSYARLKAVELPAMTRPALPYGAEHLARLESECHPSLAGAVGDLGRGLGGEGAHHHVQPLLSLLHQDQFAAAVSVLHIIRHLSRRMETY